MCAFVVLGLFFPCNAKNGERLRNDLFCVKYDVKPSPVTSNLANTIEPSVCGVDKAYVKLLRPFIIFGHAHLDSRTDSRALRAEYCIVGIPHNTAIYS